MAEKQTVTYAEQPHRKGFRALEADLWLPEGPGPFPLLTWMHSGGFRTGSRMHPAHDRIAAEFMRHGYAMAFIDYRLARPVAVLGPRTEAALPDLLAEAEAAGETMNETFLGARPMAVVEDCCAFLAYAQAHAADLRLSGRWLLGGSSAGAISALNVLWLAKSLGLVRPRIETVFAFSGGFAYPPRLHQTGARILAVHNPADDRVPVSSIRRLAGMVPDPMVLIESDFQAHGDLTLGPAETLAAAVDRCVAFDRAEDPLALRLP